MTIPSLAALLQPFFTDGLVRQRAASANTIAAYRDTFRLLLRFAGQRSGKAPTGLMLTEIDAGFVTDFLHHLEHDRGNSVRTRNARLAAVHSFFRYVALHEPARALQCERVLAIPSKRHARRSIDYLSHQESEALVDAPDLSTWLGRRDQALLIVGLQTGLRVSELIGLRGDDVVLGVGAHVRCRGKGRKQRCTPLRRDAQNVLSAWLPECPPKPDDPVFPSVRRRAMSRDAVERLVAKHAARAAVHCPTLSRKKVTPHVLRHTAAMDLLRHGVDRSVIALWLGHESVETTQMYLHADMRLKEQALAQTTAIGAQPGRYRPNDELLAFLEAL
jgi:integrase/recombinase XerD